MLRYSDFQLTLPALILSAALTGCAGSPSEIEPTQFAPTYQQLAAMSESKRQLDAINESRQGSIFRAGSERALFEDMKARRVGDILTILLVEETSGQNSSDNNVNQASGSTVAAPSFNGRSRPNLGVSLNSENSFSGQSGSSQSNSLSGSIAVTVSDVLPNGNLVVEGEKWVQINQGKEYIRLQGVVRPRDIGSYNTLYSTQVADARISYGGKGNNARNNNPGWATKLLFSPLWPF